MKNIIFVRHGKSAWNYDVNDKDRPLKERGINDGLLVSGKFKNLGITPDAIYSSPANRALHTCTIFLRKLKYDLERFRLSEELYEFSGEGVMEFVQNLDDSLDTVMIFGHNYAFTNVVNQWGSEAIDNVPTTGLVQIQFDIDFWKSAKQGKTVRTIFPKHLK